MPRAADPQVVVNGVPLLRLRPDPSILRPDPRYYQTIQGLMNISGPAVGACTPPTGHQGRSALGLRPRSAPAPAAARWHST